MKMTTDHLLANPCDEEEDNMAMLCCTSAPNDMFVMSRYPDEDELDITLNDEFSSLDGVNDMFVMSRYPDEDELDITLNDEFSSLDGVKVTLSPTRLLIEVAADDTDVFNGDDHLEITHNTDVSCLADVEQTLINILNGTGTYVSELS
ncbi:hypothetical protein [Pseudomonas weihenstephanensis]|uniref:hypothetical protein n=1 Tax=Pseudomonas weihenstephanensis TaxID=1608994 RepID=UPI00193C1809|nr:hypothetical protein [Pseudomonas weihenstephanensis]MBM1191719.1 hypothetical protein [Pseudomonas weihenstephanensis]